MVLFIVSDNTCHPSNPAALEFHSNSLVSKISPQANNSKYQMESFKEVNRITLREVEMQEEIIAPTSLLRMLQMDFNDHTVSKAPDERGLSQEDRKFLTMVERETKVVNVTVP